MKQTAIGKRLAEVLTPEFRRRYDKATRDWRAGRNLAAAAAVLYAGANQTQIARLVKFQEGELAEQRKKGRKRRISGMGTFTHDGDGFATKKKTLLFQESAVVVRIDREIVDDALVSHVWDAFCRREKTLIGELESAIARYYRKIRQRPGMKDDECPPLKRNADIWKTLGKPEIAICERDGKLAMNLYWSPVWEEEHGLYVYLSDAAKVRYIGDFA